MTANAATPLRRRSHGESGAVAVEFALVAPILIALLLGVTTAGVTWARSISLTESVRGGARFGATTLSSPAWGSAVQTRVAALAGDGLEPSQVCARLVKGASLAPVRSSTCSLPPPAVPANIAATLAATDCLTLVWARRSANISPLPFASWSLTIDRTAYERYERPC